MKRKLDVELFELLAADPDPQVRQRVACNAKLPHRLLLEVADDAEAMVAEAAQQRLETR